MRDRDDDAKEKAYHAAAVRVQWTRSLIAWSSHVLPTDDDDDETCCYC